MYGGGLLFWFFHLKSALSRYSMSYCPHLVISAGALLPDALMLHMIRTRQETEGPSNGPRCPFRHFFAHFCRLKPTVGSLSRDTGLLAPCEKAQPKELRWKERGQSPYGCWSPSPS
jgi:hypothetical protein